MQRMKWSGRQLEDSLQERDDIESLEDESREVPTAWIITTSSSQVLLAATAAAAAPCAASRA